MFGKGFNSSKCKTVARLATSRIKLLRNKREAQIRLMRRDIAMLLESGQESTATIRVEHVMREQNIMAANEIIELFCELVVVRLSIISKQRLCPADLKEGISSLIFAAPRCSEIPELLQIRDIFEKKYGKDFVGAAMELRPDCGVNRTLIEKLSVRTPTGQTKLKVMKEIAKEYHIEWDTTETELELLKAHEELIEGPKTFVSASSMLIKSASSRVLEPNESTKREGLKASVSAKTMPVKSVSSPVPELKQSTERFPNGIDSCNMQFMDAASAAQVAADSAEKAIAAAQLAAYLANQNSQTKTASFAIKGDNFSVSSNPSVVKTFQELQSMTSSNSNPPSRLHESQCYSGLDHARDVETSMDLNVGVTQRRHSENVHRSHSDVKFDDSDGEDSEIDEEIEMETQPVSHPPPSRPPPPLRPFKANLPEERVDNTLSPKENQVSRVHPKLPDYDSLAARFEALKFRKS